MFNISESQRRASVRLGRSSTRRRRSDAGQSRLPPMVLSELRSVALGTDRPSMTATQRRIAELCVRHGLPLPSRASLYKAFATIEGHTYQVSSLPACAREALYNLAPDSVVPGHQVVLHCFNYGTLSGVSFAAGLPWLDLYQAARLRGWRPRSRGLLEAVKKARGIR
jgi:hypothetical protein